MDDITFKARYQSARTGWKNFVADKDFDKNTGVNPDVYQSWIESRAAGVSALEMQLPPITKQDKSLVNQGYTDYTIFLHDRFSAFFRKKERLLSIFGGVGLWMDNHLQVFHKLGDSKLIDKLREVNIKYGTSFREDRIGTNAVALANQLNAETWVIGDENYHRALKEYVTCSSPRMRQGFVEGFMMLIFPLSEFNETKLFLCDYMLDAFYHLYDDEERLEHASRNMIIKASLRRTNSCYFVCDTLGRLVEASDNFYRLMRTDPQLVAGKPIDTTFTFVPSLSNRFAGKKEETFQCTIKEPQTGTARRYTVESFPVMVNSSYSSGTLFILTDAKSMSEYIKRMSSKRNPYTFDQIVGNSESFRNAIQLAIAAAKSSSSILIQGDSGTGKELFAQAIHAQRFPDTDKPFVAINCGGLSRDLLNSELFGYVEGAFTGAKKGGAPGKFELANGGTLFFDEVGEMPLEMQAALLRALEERAITRVGGSMRTPIDVRILSATNRDLWQMVQEGTFRLDLYYRLNVISIRIPPLRDRRDDILMLANHFIEDFSSELGKNIIGYSEEYERHLLAYDWPGNVRELKNVIERSVNLEEGPLLIDCSYLRSLSRSAHNEKYGITGSAELFTSLRPSNYQDYEKILIEELLITHRGNKTKVASELGISRKTLYNKMHRYGMSLS
ncbi:sigma-54-dependent Fis family transcriptional regulator [Adlercreutzia sp. ZJ138]|uniref:sigma-54 interaction domain-containing protein n=1 Tax=Adlercreutzia sp. ZJ138 TaxID=2709405 RepID=UPI0013EC22C8|nr:sigma 54-interacting transcriptional regulator [Adlercreutzia sp. ZJ138]